MVTCQINQKIFTMKTTRLNHRLSINKFIGATVFLTILCSCNNNQLVQQYKALHEHDSILALQTQADDSTIKGYINNMNEIQSNLDEIKSREKILTVQGENKTNGNAIEDIKAIDSLII